jgi:phosphotransferase system  glucose/maltose/N-acetylglucosamine-specific IIC component
MSLILVLLAIALLGVVGWGIQSIMTELAKPYPGIRSILFPADLRSRVSSGAHVRHAHCAVNTLRRRRAVSRRRSA